MGNAFCYLSSLLGSVLVLVFLICCFVFNLVTCSLVEFFSCNYTGYMSVNLFLLRFHVVNAVNDAITLYWHLLHCSLSRETSSWDFYTGKKLCKRDDSRGRVLLWLSWVLPGEHLSFSYNRYDAISSFLLSMLLAPPVVW